MALPNYAVENDQQLETAARDKTSYSTEQLPGDYQSGQAFGLMQDAKRVLHMRAGASAWYSDLAFGQALVALTAMKFKEAVENIEVESYGIGDEDVQFYNADPESSQQLISWSNEINEGIRRSAVETEEDSVKFKNTASYIG